MKERKKLNKKKALGISSVIAGMGLLGYMGYAEYASIQSNENRIPELTVYQKNDHAKLEWSVDILDSDVLYASSFETGEQIPTFGWGSWGLGGQSHTSETAYSGTKSVKSFNTIQNGNHINFPATYSSRSIMGWGRLYFPNGTPLSLTFYAKTDSQGTVIPYGDGGWATTIQNVGSIKIAETSQAGQNKVKVDSLTGISVGSYITTDTDPQATATMYVVSSIDTSTKTLTLNGNLSRTLTQGESLKTRPWRGAWSFNTRTVHASEGWKRFSINTFVSNYSDYNVGVRGGQFYIDTETGGTLYIDDVKFGYSTQAELYRNGAKIYEGYLSDYEDVDAKDKAVPNGVSNITSTRDDNGISFKFSKPEDNGTTYNYQIKGKAINGETPLSAVKPITIKTGIKGYSYVIDTNPSTIPDNTVDTTSTEVSKAITSGNKYYLHIKSIDEAGNVSSVSHKSISVPTLTGTPMPEEDYVKLSWNPNDTSQQFNYRIYMKKEGESEFQTIPAKPTVKVLEVYPYVPLLKGWMDSYGLGKISVDSMRIEDFNQNPSTMWNYDVVVFGFADSNNGKDLSALGEAETEKYIKAGKGVLLGHDTMRDFAMPQFTKLSPFINMDYDAKATWFYGYMNDGATSDGWAGHSKVRITTKGLLTNYPWKIGDVGTDLVVPRTHTVQQIPKGDIWMKFVDGNDVTMTNPANFYLTTWNNVAMAQTGHKIYPNYVTPDQYASEDEQKILANTMFYLAQITDQTSWDDHMGQDVAKPNKPTITSVTPKGDLDKTELVYTPVEDNGSKYQYYVEASGSNSEGKVASNKIEVDMKSGIKGYSIVIDQNPTTIPDSTIETTDTRYTVNQRLNGNFYVHVASVDKVGNVSDVAHYQYTDKQPPTLTVSSNDNNWTDKAVTIQAEASDNETGILRIKLPNGNYVNSRSVDFSVSEPGTYTFIAEDKAGNQTSKTITITTISKKPTLTATAVPEEDFIQLNWNAPDDWQRYSYMLYQRKEGEEEFQSIPAKSNAKVLNIYPRTDAKTTFTNWKGETSTIPISASIKKWMEEPNHENAKGYGQGLIDVDTVSIPEFNANPTAYLKNPDGSWKYDVVFEGALDGNGFRLEDDYSQQAVIALEEWIASGQGYLSGHDTIMYPAIWNTNTNQLRDDLNIKVTTLDPITNGVGSTGGTTGTVTVKIKNKGFLTNYPWKIGDINTLLTVPASHNTGNVTYGNVWMDYTVFSGRMTDINGEGNANFYLTTWNNTAMIQTGHSNGQATPDEQKVLANTLFYLAQITDQTSWEDHTGQDVSAPTKPVISTVTPSIVNEKTSISFSASVDKGTTYDYYVEATGVKNNSKTPSDIETETITSGLKGYSILVDTNPNSIPDNVIETTSTSYIENRAWRENFYVHVASIDKVGNISEVSHYRYEDNEAPVLTVTPSTTGWLTGNVVLTAKAIDNSIGVKRIKLPNGNWIAGDTASYTVSANGTYTFVAEDNYGNQSMKSITITNIDTTAPTVPSISNNQEWTKDTPVSVSITPGTDNQSGMRTTEYKLEGATQKGWTTYNDTIQIVNEGITKISARSIDKVGNVSLEATSYVRIDKSKPHNTGITIELKP
jgi:hypothetical protein